MNERSELLTEAEEIFGRETVETVTDSVQRFGPEVALSMFTGMGMKEHVKCLEFIYIDNQ